MTALTDKIAGLITKSCPDLQIFLRSENGTRCLTVSGRKQAAMYAAGFVFVTWSFVATAALLISALWSDGDQVQISVLSDAYETRLGELTTETASLSSEAQDTRRKFYNARDRISAQQDALFSEIAERQRLEISLDVMRNKLSDAVVAQDEARAENRVLTAQLETVTAGADAIDGNQQDLSQTLIAISSALSDTVKSRDAARGEVANLEESLAEFEIRVKVNAERQNLLLTRLEEAVAMSFEPLDKMFENVGIDVDGLMSQVRRNYSGTGGPLMPLAMSTKSFAEIDLSGASDLESTLRFKDLMLDLENLSLIQIAAAQVPLGQPVRARFRFTSGFGYRGDPKSGGRRLHKGADLAAPRGTPILATGDGEVIFAGVQSGYGKFIKIRHSSGFVTAYAHLNGIDVKTGQKVTRGEQIGRMGNSGRSTGNHLHYEVRRNGKPVNPMTYLKAAENVY